MNLLSEEWIRQKKSRLMTARLLFYALALLCAAGYGFSFTADNLLPPLLTGAFSALVLTLAYFALLYPRKKTVKLLRQMQTGLLQEETYVFLRTDGETERDGVTLTRITVKTCGEEVYERTLYALSEAPLPSLEAEKAFTGKTYQNIIVEIKD